MSGISAELARSCVRRKASREGDVAKLVPVRLDTFAEVNKFGNDVCEGKQAQSTKIVALVVALMALC